MVDNNQLNCLFDYTKFHIGVYMTLIGLLLGAQLNPVSRALLEPVHRWIVFTVICYAIAGAAGGAIISNIPDSKTYETFAIEKLDLFGLKTFKYIAWAHIEHASFWLGSIALIYSILKPLHSK